MYIVRVILIPGLNFRPKGGGGGPPSVSEEAVIFSIQTIFPGSILSQKVVLHTFLPIPVQLSPAMSAQS